MLQESYPYLRPRELEDRHRFRRPVRVARQTRSKTRHPNMRFEKRQTSSAFSDVVTKPADAPARSFELFSNFEPHGSRQVLRMGYAQL